MSPGSSNGTKGRAQGRLQQPATSSRRRAAGSGRGSNLRARWNLWHPLPLALQRHQHERRRRAAHALLVTRRVVMFAPMRPSPIRPNCMVTVPPHFSAIAALCSAPSLLGWQPTNYEWRSIALASLLLFALPSDSFFLRQPVPVLLDDTSPAANSPRMGRVASLHSPSQSFRLPCPHLSALTSERSKISRRAKSGLPCRSRRAKALRTRIGVA